MSEALSVDPWERVVVAVYADAFCRAAARFGVGAASAIRWAVLAREAGSVAPGLLGGDRRSARTEAHALLIPRQATVDTQTVKGLPVRGPRGFDGAKRVVGRKRVALVAAEGDRPAGRRGRPRFRAGARRAAGTRCWSGGVAQPARSDTGRRLHRRRVPRVVQPARHAPRSRRPPTRPPDQKGFAVLPRRWVIARGFGWLTHRGGLLRDRAGRLGAAARIACAAILDTTEALIRPGRPRPNRP